MIYEETTWHDIEKRIINIQPTTKVTVIGVNCQKDYRVCDMKWDFKFDYYEVLGVRDGYISQMKLYTTHRP